MTEFTSDIKTIPYSDERVFAVLSDLNNLERFKTQLPADKVKNFTFDRDSCSMEINPVGKVELSVTDREPNQTLKLEALHAIVPMNIWIQLKPLDEKETKMKITLRASLNPFLKAIAAKPIQSALDKVSEVLASLSYE